MRLSIGRCLDPTFPGLHQLASLDVDGFMTNSNSALAHLTGSSGMEAVYLPLAADPGAVNAGQHWLQHNGSDRTSPHSIIGDTTAEENDKKMGARVRAAVEAVRGRVLYLGSAGGLGTKQMLAPMLAEAAETEQGLVILGNGWGEEPRWAPYWRGVLPHVSGALAAVYSEAAAIPSYLIVYKQ